eukprot:evm.model.scf_1010.2 EVM.evm.TU.scf_1010.2   scf_1010:3116-4680(+)
MLSPTARGLGAPLVVGGTRHALVPKPMAGAGRWPGGARGRGPLDCRGIAAGHPISGSGRPYVDPPMPKWWQRCTEENMIEVSSPREFVKAMNDAGDRLVVVKFYARQCNSCRAVFPKVCKLCAAVPDVVFLKVSFDANRKLCKALGVKVIPFFHFYRNAGLLDQFSASLSKVQLLKDAISRHNTPRCPLGPAEPIHSDVMALATQLEEG